MRKYVYLAGFVALAAFTLYTGGFCASAQQVPTFDSRWVFSTPGPLQPAPSPGLTQTAPKAENAPTASPAPANGTQAGTVVSGGTLAGEILQWLAVTFGGILGTGLTGVLVRWFQRLGQNITDADRARLNDGVNNAVGWAAHQLRVDLDGKLPFNVRSEIIAEAIKYAEAHMGDTLKDLGAKPGTLASANAIRARAAVILAQPSAPALPPPLEAPAQILTTADVPGRDGNTRVVRGRRK